MFSEELKQLLENLGVNPEESPYFIRTTLEDLLDESAEYINTMHHNKYLVAERAYSTFMEEYTHILDVGDALFE
jgi:hypothetical protein